MESIGSYEAKTHLPALLKRVEGGEHLTITRHGRPVARLVPVVEEPLLSAAEAAAGLLHLRRRCTLGEGHSVRAILDEGRR